MRERMTNSPSHHLVYKSRKSSTMTNPSSSSTHQQYHHHNNNNLRKDGIKVSTMSLGTPIAHSSSTFTSLLKGDDKKRSSRLCPSSSNMFKHSLLNPKHHLSFVALSVGFLLIWVCVISGLLLTESMSDRQIVEEAEEILKGHQDVGRVLFALGHEMVSTVDLLLSIQESRPDMIGYSKEALQITWDMTDVIFNQVMSRNNMKLSAILSSPYQRWMEFRGRSISATSDAREAINLYLILSKEIEGSYQSFTPKSWSSGNHLKNPFVNSGVSYGLFNSAMYMRFGEIALGTCYVRSLIMINNTEYLELQFTSRSLIEAAFQFHPRAIQRFHELRSASMDGTPDQSQEVLSIVRQDMLTGGRSRNNSKLAGLYLEGVKNEIAQLLLSKDYLNSTIWSQVKSVKSANQSSLLFSVSVSVIALVAVMSCFVLLCLAIRSLSRQQYLIRPSRERIVYKANTLKTVGSQGYHHHQQSMNQLSHGQELRTRSQTLPNIETIFNPFNIGVSVDRPSATQQTSGRQPHSLRGQGHTTSVSGRNPFANLPASPAFLTGYDKNGYFIF